MQKKQTLKYILCDYLAALLSWGALFTFRKVVLEAQFSTFNFQFSILSDSNFWLGLLLIPLGWLSLYTIQGTYRNTLRKARLPELLDTALATLIGSVVLFFLLLIDDQVGPLRNHYLAFLFLLAVHFLLTYLPRLLLTSQTVRRVHSREIGFPTLMIGSGSKALHTYLDIENQETYSGNLFVGYIMVNNNSSFITHHSSPITHHSSLITHHSSLITHHSSLENVMPCLGSLADLRTLVEKHHIEEVIIALEEDQKDHIGDILRTLNTSGDLIIKLTPDTRDLVIGSVKQDSIFHSPFIVINNRLMPEWAYSVKRLGDIFLSLLAMVLLSPVYLVTAIIVKCTSPGPVFYAQERIGYHGRAFRMHKFRSMYVDAEQSGPALSKDDDPRITPFGRFMRKVRLDEIPQFWNVLRGTMSIVGPRPERQFYIDQIVKRAPEYMLLQRVKPGITSWGQVKYGYASTVDEMVERLRYDLLYLDNMSITTDLKIMVYTAKIILQGRGK